MYIQPVIIIPNITNQCLLVYECLWTIIIPINYSYIYHKP